MSSSDTDVLSFEYTYVTAGSYNVTLTTQFPICPDTTESANIIVHEKPVITTSSDTTVAYGSFVELYANGADFYTWTPDKYLDFPNSNSPKYNALDSATLQIIGMNQWGCKDTAYEHIDIDYSMFETIPTAFSPNGDGRNDVFRVSHIKYQRIIEFRIYNRWGQQVFSDTGNNAGWDGTYKGQLADVGVYQYLIRVATPEGLQKLYKGDVSLIR